jgi:peptidoglycan hydrolase CwlO-like protein
MTFAETLTWGRAYMAEIDGKVHARPDARQLWLPITTVLVIVLAIVGATVGGSVAVGRWIERNTQQEGTVTSVASELKTLNTQISTMQGSINALMGMQQQLAETSASVGSMKNEMQSFDTRLQTMDAWIQTTRGRLLEQGFRNLPEYQPHRGSGGS